MVFLTPEYCICAYFFPWAFKTQSDRKKYTKNSLLEGSTRVKSYIFCCHFCKYFWTNKILTFFKKSSQSSFYALRMLCKVRITFLANVFYLVYIQHCVSGTWSLGTHKQMCRNKWSGICSAVVLKTSEAVRLFA